MKSGMWFSPSLSTSTLSGCCVPGQTVASLRVAQGIVYISEWCADEFVQEILFFLWTYWEIL